MKNAVKYQARSTLGICSLSAAQEQSWAEIVGAMYEKTNCIYLLKNSRAEMSDKGIHAKKLPPTEDSLHQHFMYQLYIWINANVAWQELPRAQDLGYKKVWRPVNSTDGQSGIIYDLVCLCEEHKYDDECVCQLNEQPYTTGFSCKAVGKVNLMKRIENNAQYRQWKWLRIW